jgi:hypothetical protein
MIRLSRHAVQCTLTLMALVILSPLTGCGFKDKPIPPQQIVPRPVNDLQYQLGENGVTLFWSYPKETITGRDLTNITSFALYRAVVPVDSYCDTCPIPFASPIVLPVVPSLNEAAKQRPIKSPSCVPATFIFLKSAAKADGGLNRRIPISSRSCGKRRPWPLKTSLQQRVTGQFRSAGTR